jgi:hypothetical protein
LIRAKETRFGPVAVVEALREAAKSGPSEGSRRTDDAHARRSTPIDPAETGVSMCG